MTYHKRNFSRNVQLVVAGFWALLLTACNHPDKANIELRQEIQKLNTETAALKIRHRGDEATIKALLGSTGTPPEVTQSVIEKLFTVHGIQLGRTTGPDNWDSSQPGDTGLKVSLIPIDEQGDKLKAAGRVHIQAFDLARPEKPLMGEWKFDTKQTRESWYGGAFAYDYVFKCPWVEPPAHRELTIKVTFVDELTGREFTAQKVAKVTPQPATTRPATVPATTQSTRPA